MQGDDIEVFATCWTDDFYSQKSMFESAKMLPSPDDYNPDPLDRAIEPGALWMLAYFVVPWLTELAEVVHGLGPREQFEAGNRLHRGGHCPMAVSVQVKRVETWMIVA